MQNLQKTYEKIFKEIRMLLKDLSKSESCEEFLSKENEINTLYQKFSFLKISRNFGVSPTENAPLELSENQQTNRTSEIQFAENSELANKVSEKTTKETETQIFSHISETEEEHHEKKFKLAHIRGLNVEKTLFDDDSQENEEKQPEISDTEHRKNNDSEIHKPKSELKLDLNDRIAFSQHLFAGSQSALNEVITKLNSYNDLEKAKEYLSELYYEKHWEKVDAYAQRLWILVENRFFK